MKDIREEGPWYLIIDDKGYEIGDWEDTLLELEVRVKDNPGKQIILLSKKEYSVRYTKRGKNSKKEK